MRGGALVVLVACSDYELGSKQDPETLPPETPTGTTVTGTTPYVPPETTPDTGTPPAPSCDDFVAPVISWTGSAPFTDPADPVDGSGRPFWDPAADTSSYAPVALPDLSVPVGHDRAYVGTFDLAEIPVDLSLHLESDDGIWVWLNGVEVGHWGGDWQQEGCVNEHANCVLTTHVEPVDVTPLLAAGPNVVAARVSNPVLDAYFDLLPECVDDAP